jgi:hypothetical protein
MYKQVQAQTSASVVPGGSSSNVYRPPVKYLLESVQSHLVFTNSSLAQVECDIYEMLSKRDVDDTVAMSVPSGTFTAYPTPDDLWVQGSIWQNGLPTGTVPPSSNIGASPFDVNWVKQYFKCIKKLRVQLAPGASHRHAINGKYGKLIDGALIDQALGSGSSRNTGIPYNWRGLTRYWMIVQRGFPVSTVKTDTVPSLVTTADTHLDVVFDTRYKFTYVVNNASIVYNTDNLVSLAENVEPEVITTFNSQKAINAATGQ